MKVERPSLLEGITSVHETGCGKLYIVINNKDNQPFEVFLYGSQIVCTGMLQGLGRMLSLSLRSGIPISEIVSQLKSIRCFNSVGKVSCYKAISDSLAESYLANKTVDKVQ